MDERGRLENITDFVRAVAQSEGQQAGFVVAQDAEMFCSRCQAPRRMRFYRWFRRDTGVHASATLKGIPEATCLKLLTPSAYGLMCVQCDAHSLAVIYPGPNAEPELVILRGTAGGLASPNAPASVTYYLDQAMRSQSVGARSAALAMYRAALEHLLYEQGFQTGMCGQKIAALEKAVVDGSAPKWATELDAVDLRVIKQLGDGAIHPNGGDVSKQDVVTSDLIIAVMAEFEKLLEHVYERPARERERREKIKAAAAQLK